MQLASLRWAMLVGLAGLFAFGIAMATTSLVQDLMAYVFIRMNNWFTENDLIYYNGGLLQVAAGWAYTRQFPRYQALRTVQIIWRTQRREL